ncbi:hypothetical protein DSAG12_04350 [Promethearchaeum syntrophicum]|uniref:Uncharacterized protein n=1 Tax=Promethearchaeum syntrophicum TaxID=2594042 RepID=A0AC61ZU19_9ARCH
MIYNSKKKKTQKIRGIEPNIVERLQFSWKVIYPANHFIKEDEIWEYEEDAIRRYRKERKGEIEYNHHFEKKDRRNYLIIIIRQQNILTKVGKKFGSNIRK